MKMMMMIPERLLRERSGTIAALRELLTGNRLIHAPGTRAGGDRRIGLRREPFAG